jgi:hypothetical protein
MPASVGVRAVIVVAQSTGTAVTASAPARSGRVSQMTVAGS